jgi:hypothetical protein
LNVSHSKNGKSTDYVGAPGSVIPMSASTQSIGNLKPGLPHGSSDIEVQRINPDILKAFRENPYTFSLTNSA